MTSKTDLYHLPITADLWQHVSVRYWELGLSEVKIRSWEASNGKHF